MLGGGREREREGGRSFEKQVEKEVWLSKQMCFQPSVTHLRNDTKAHTNRGSKIKTQPQKKKKMGKRVLFLKMSGSESIFGETA